MKKNPIIRGISGVALLLGGALVVLGSISAAGAPGALGATAAQGEDGTVVPTAGRCDEVSIRSCRTSCIRSCHHGLLFRGCSTSCDRTCRSRFCR